jgi:hypothetical protein
MRDLSEKIDLNAPAFGQGAQGLDILTKEPEDHSFEENVEHKEDEENIDSVEENKVPYSRFKNIHNRAIEAEAEAEKWRQRAEEFEKSRNSNSESNNQSEMPSYWKELYGDSEVSQKAWEIQQKREDEIERRAYEAGQRGARELESSQREVINTNVAKIDESFEDLSAFIGRDLTSKEQSQILDIVDDYTAKDDNGNYQGAIMPFDKAWKILELQKNSSKSSQRSDRDSVASLSGVTSQGNTDIQVEKDKNWNPLARGSWRSRL